MQRPGPRGGYRRAAIGDQLRIPIMWGEMGRPGSPGMPIPQRSARRTTAPGPSGAGGRIDALGRIACPRCQQTAVDFRASARSRRGTGTRLSPWPPGPPPGAATAPLEALDGETVATLPPGQRPSPRQPAGARTAPCTPAASTVAAGLQTRRTPANTTIPAACCRSWDRARRSHGTAGRRRADR